jgi:hypothetical protein
MKVYGSTTRNSRVKPSVVPSYLVFHNWKCNLICNQCPSFDRAARGPCYPARAVSLQASARCQIRARRYFGYHSVCH